MGGKYGYAQIAKVAFFGLAFGEALEKSVHNSSAIGKAAAFLSCVDEGVELLSLDRDLLKKEFAEFDEDDKAGLLTECANEFNLDDKDLERKIEASIAAGFQILEGIEAAMKAWNGGAQT